METKLSKILKNLASFFIYCLVFLTPLFFLPLTIEPLELNKYFLLYLFIFLAVLCWVSRGVLRKTFEFRRTPLDIPLLILWLAALVSSIVSKDRFVSFFGDFSLLNLSFLNLTVFLFFYFLAVQETASVKKALNLIYTLFFSCLLASVYFLTKTLGLFDWSFLGISGNNLVNISNNSWGIFLVAFLSLSLAFLAVRKRQLAGDFLSLAVFLFSLAGVVLIGFKILWVVTVIALALLIVFLISNVSELRVVWISVAFGVLVAGIVFIFFGEPQFLTTKLPVEISLSPSTSGSMLKEELTTGARYFLFGSGLATFPYDFSQFRPVSLNNNFAWNVRFRQPFSSAFEWAMSGGILSSLALLLAILIVVGIVVQTWFNQMAILRRRKSAAEDILLEESHLVFWGVTVAFFTLLVAFFVVNMGVVHWFLFWLFLALMVSTGAILSKNSLKEIVISLKTTPEYSLLTSFAFILVFTGILVLGIYLGRFYKAEAVYRQALRLPMVGQEGGERISKIQKAAILNPQRSLFYLSLAESLLFKAQEAAASNDANQTVQWVAVAVDAAKRASVVSPESAASWESLATMYANARAFAPQINSELIASLEKAAALEPTNPTFYLGLGSAKFFERRYSEAKESFEKAVALKPDLLRGYALLAGIFEAEKNLDGAIAVLEKSLPFGRNDAAFVYQLGNYYYTRHKKDDWPLAERAFRRAIALSPNYSDALYSLALLYEKTNNRQPALELYRRVLELNPGNNQVEAKIGNLSGAPAASESEGASLPLSEEKKKK
ncbi:MAG: tetratricopeptide repeat protein [Candidatus Magasanikbacteria bacterium]|nr:tetratricopeptide repeat protein [Candidatus Magasanikbacteria bacterium]